MTDGNLSSPVSYVDYLDEFAIRFNRRLSTHCGKLFYRLVTAAVASTPAPYTKLMPLERHR